MKNSILQINAHGHAAMTAFRGRAEDVPLDSWLRDYIWPAESAEVNATMVYTETRRAIREMRANGIDAFVDMYFFQEEVARAAIDEKMPVLVGEGILDFPTPSSSNPDEALAKTEDMALRYAGHDLVSVSVAPHSIYALSEDKLLASKKLARDHKLLWQIHAAETKKERDDCLAQHSFTPIAYLDKLGLLDEFSLLAHCVWIDDNDIAILARCKSSVTHCPLSNLKLGSGVAPIAKLVSAGVNVLLGTDGAASSNRLDIWEAAKFAALLQKGVTLDAAALSARVVYRMMGYNAFSILDPKIFHSFDPAVLKTGCETLDPALLYN